MLSLQKPINKARECSGWNVYWFWRGYD